MKADEIEKWLERYDNGETSEKEEQELLRFFQVENVPSHLQADKEYFLQLKQVRDEQPPQDLEIRLSSLIDSWDTEEKRLGKGRSILRSIRWQWVSGIVAGLLVLFGVGICLYERWEIPSVRQDTCSSPEEAYQETWKALVLFSSALNKGLKKMETIPQATEKMQESVYEQLNQIKK